MSVVFHDFSDEVKVKMKREAIGWLKEAGGEMVAATVKASPQTKWHREVARGWEYEVDEDKLEGIIGNPYEASLWVEFGTGKHSESPKGGRKGYWVFVKDGDPVNGLYRIYSYSPDVYTLEEAKAIMARLKSDGLDAHITSGQEAKRPLKTAYTKMRPKLIKRARERFKNL